MKGVIMWDAEKRDVLEAAQHMARKGLVVGTSGNVSMRIEESTGRELLAITPSGRYYDSLGINDIVVLDFEGNRVEGELSASIESMLHIGIYRARRKVNAIVHTHAACGSAFAVAGLAIPAILDDQVTYIGGEIEVADYALPGSPELVQNVLSALGARNAVLMANHGALSVGSDMREAFDACELLEKAAMTYIWATVLGKVNPLPAEAAEVEKAFFAAIHDEGD
jgi:L-fuculose-phosphate aldolase